MKRFQAGGFVIGLVVGVLLGLVAALGVALYVTKVPVPWVNKVPQRTAEQDAAEAERNKNWDPNAGLSTRPAPPPPPPSLPAPPPPAAAPQPAAPPAAAVAGKPSTPAPVRDPAAILSGKPVPPAPAVSSGPGADPFTYFVQAGAYARTEEAEQQRARLAMIGLSAKVTEREQSGRTVYRVRLGPFEKKAEADAAKGQLESNGVEAALVRVQKQ